MTKNINSNIKSSSKWFAGIDSLRFILAMIVLLGHLRKSNC